MAENEDKAAREAAEAERKANEENERKAADEAKARDAEVAAASKQAAAAVPHDRVAMASRKPDGTPVALDGSDRVEFVGDPDVVDASRRKQLTEQAVSVADEALRQGVSEPVPYEDAVKAHDKARAKAERHADAERREHERK